MQKPQLGDIRRMMKYPKNVDKNPNKNLWLFSSKPWHPDGTLALK
jgi:hypothetical protein